jgi:hypothetical protein
MERQTGSGQRRSGRWPPAFEEGFEAGRRRIGRLWRQLRDRELRIPPEILRRRSHARIRIPAFDLYVETADLRVRIQRVAGIAPLELFDNRSNVRQQLLIFG